MSTTFALAIYFVCWWIVLFAILPLRLGAETGRDVHAEASGAPMEPRLGLKFLITTAVSTVIFAIIYVTLVYRLVTLDTLPI